MFFSEIDIVKSINKKALNEYSDEEDFMFGTMLGYDRIQKCKRYLKRKFSKEIAGELIG